MTQPFTTDRAALLFHFPDQFGIGTPYGPENQLATGAIAAAIERRDDFQLGIALHTFADAFSHAGFSWRYGAPGNYRSPSQAFPPPYGHAQFYKAPDDLRARALVGAEAATECYRYLRQYALRRGVEKPLVDEDDLLLTLEVVFSGLPEELNRRGPALREVFGVWGVDVPSDLGSEFSDWSPDYRSARSRHGEFLSKAVRATRLRGSPDPVR